MSFQKIMIHLYTINNGVLILIMLDNKPFIINNLNTSLTKSPRKNEHKSVLKYILY